MNDTQTEVSPRERIQAVIDELGLAMTTEFVPLSKSRNAKPRKEDGKVWRSLNWRVSLWRKVPRVGLIYKMLIVETDYAQGEGHCPAYKASVKVLGGRNCIMRDEAIAWECEKGFEGLHTPGYGAMRKPDSAPLVPDVVDVVHSLVSDSDVLDYGTFEDWAESVGYDADSRSAEKIYRACLEIALKLRNGVGEVGLAKLRDACQDY